MSLNLKCQIENPWNSSIQVESNEVLTNLILRGHCCIFLETHQCVIPNSHATTFQFGSLSYLIFRHPHDSIVIMLLAQTERLGLFWGAKISGVPLPPRILSASLLPLERALWANEVASRLATLRMMTWRIATAFWLDKKVCKLRLGTNDWWVQTVRSLQFTHLLPNMFKHIF